MPLVNFPTHCKPDNRPSHESKSNTGWAMKLGVVAAALLLVITAKPVRAISWDDVEDAWDNVEHVGQRTTDHVRQTFSRPGEAIQGTIDGIRRDPVGNILYPMRNANITGLPDLGAMTVDVLRDPAALQRLMDDPFSIFGGPLAAAIISSRDAALRQNPRPIPWHVQQTLRPYFPQHLLSSVKWVPDSGILGGTVSVLTVGMADANAVTLIDVVVFRNIASVESYKLWAHELEHVLQYEAMGLLSFSARYSTNPDSLEGPAYAKDAWVENQLAQQTNWSGPPPINRPFGQGPSQLMANLCVVNGGSCPLNGGINVQQPCVCWDHFRRPWPGTAWRQ